MRGHAPKTHSDTGLAAVIRDTTRLWRRHDLGYDQTKLVAQSEVHVALRKGRAGDAAVSSGTGSIDFGCNDMGGPSPSSE